ncbi:hyalin-like [Amphiura filiformis]|uniref:hyalin-like n=1 Tax=Amphiura filiformis TaxID=82378 RepID=UPI003B20F5C0
MCTVVEVIKQYQTNPSITCPDNVFTNTGQAFWSIATAEDNLDDQPDVSCDSISGAIFPLGETPVECIATDNAGNSATCTFVVIGDQEIPTITCPSDLLASTNPVSWSSLIASDNYNDPPPAVTCSPPSESDFNEGETTVTCTAADNAGNTRTCTFVVTMDFEGPTFTCPGAIDSTVGQVSYATPNAVDNVDQMVQVTCVPASDTTFPNGVSTVTCSSTDDAGNTNMCSFTVTVDAIPPTIMCPAAITTTSTTVQYMIPMGSDNLDATPTVTCNPSPGSVFTIGTSTLVTCTVTDFVGLSSSCTFTVTVDQSNPTITSCPGDMTVSTSQPSWPDPTATDDTQIEISCTPSSGTVFQDGDTTVICTATDAAGNTDTCSFTVTLDSEAPTISCPADLFEPANPVSFSSPTASDNTDPTPEVTCDHTEGTFPEGKTIVLCRATDNAGNVKTCTFSVTVDTGNPSITCPANLVSNNPVSWPPLDVVDTIDTMLTVVCSPSSDSNFGGGQTSVTCTVTDDAGNSASCTFTVTLDETSPTIMCPATVTVQTNQVTYSNPTVSDNADNAPVVTCDMPSESTFELGETSVTCTATDEAGNSATCSFLVTVDQEAPSITCPLDITTSMTTVTWDNPTVSDNRDTDVQFTCTHTSGASYPVEQTTVSCTATDDAGNTNTCSFFILVDQSIPVLSCPTHLYDSNAQISWTHLVTSSDVDSIITCNPQSGSTLDVDQTTSVTCTATDDASNSDTCTFLVTIDQENPTITCSPDLTVSTNVVSWPNFPTVFDNIDMLVTVSCAPSSGSTFTVGQTQVTCTGTDDAGNSATCTFDVTVDQTNPVIGMCPANIVVSTNQVSYTVPSATDDVDQATSVSCSPSSDSIFPTDQSTPVTCTATDDAGNSATCMFSVTVDKTAPMISCPNNIITSTSVDTYTNPTATDNNDQPPTVTCNPASDSTFQSGQTTVTCTATDDANNMASCSFSVTVDQVNPTITCPASFIVATNPVSWADLDVSDNTVDPAPQVSCTPLSSGMDFNTGVTTVTCTATDGAGNTASCMFMVTLDL